MSWISVKDRLPEIEDKNKKSAVRVHIKLDDRRVREALYMNYFCKDSSGDIKLTGYVFYNMDGKVFHPTHWIPLPLPPEKE